jgi:hypothetical protein
MTSPDTTAEANPPDALEQAISIAREAARQIMRLLGPNPDRGQCQKVLSAFRHVISPGKQPGRRRNAGITAAHRDWKSGMYGLALYKKHIPGWETHSRWRRAAEARRLMDAIRSRERREREKQIRGTLGLTPA